MPARSAILALTLCCPLAAQDLGRGSLGPNGLEPRLEIESTAPGGTLRFSVRDLAPPAQSGMQLFLLLGALPAEIPLDGLGVRGAVLGFDPAVMLLTGPWPVDARGRADLRVTMQKAWDGAQLIVQALSFDPRVPSKLVLSDSRSMTLGAASGTIPLLRDDGAGGLTFARFLADGRPGPLARRDRLQILDLALPSIDEERRYRRDLPRPIRILGRGAVQLPDGSSLVRVHDGRRQRQTIYRAYRGGRIEVVAETAATFAPQIAASPTHVAFVEAPSGKLLLYRVDGSNWPRITEPLIDATPAKGLVVDPVPLCFGSRKLCYVDRARGVFLIDLASAKASAVKLPPSGGRTPVFHDEEVGVSADGRSFVFGAGPGKKSKDIYVVRDSGTAVNVTRRVTDYAEVGYSNRGRRTEMVLDPLGTRVAYVDEGGKEPEGYVTTIATRATVHMTGPVSFVDSIDIGSTARLLPGGASLLIAGMNETSLDLFYSATTTPKDIVSLTKTGSATKAPWGRDAKLDVLDLGSLAGKPQYLLHAKHQARIAPELWVVDPGKKTARRATSSFAGLATVDRSSTRVWAVDAAQIVTIDPTNSGSGFAKKVSLGAATALRSLAADARLSTVFVMASTSSARELWLVDNSARATRLAQSSGSDAELLSHESGTAHLLSPVGSKGRTLLRWRASDGLRSVGGQGLRAFLLRD